MDGVTCMQTSNLLSVYMFGCVHSNYTQFLDILNINLLFLVHILSVIGLSMR